MKRENRYDRKYLSLKLHPTHNRNREFVRLCKMPREK